MKKTGVCIVTKQVFPVEELVMGKNIRGGLFDLIRKDYPEFDDSSYILHAELNKYRRYYLEQLVTEEKGELSAFEKEVIDSISRNEIMSANIEETIDSKLTLGQQVADGIAKFGGSWHFIISFFVFLIIWMITNIVFLASRAFDPYPFILLNLILSCLAAIQAPVIMMSQNMKEDKDRQRSEHDYKVNLKAELEIRILHEKLDHLIHTQNERLFEIQELQMDALQDILECLKINGKKNKHDSQ